MTKKLSIGILGCAAIAKKYAINAFKSLDEVEAITIASRDPKNGKRCAKEFGIGYAQSYEALLDDKKIDAIYIPLPISLHERWVKKAAAKEKHILCEKSLSNTWQGSKNIISACKGEKLVLFENFACDFHPQHEKVLSMIKRGMLGKPRLFRGYFGFPKRSGDDFRYKKEMGGGCLNDAGAYTVFMARKIFGEEPKAVSLNLDFDGMEVDMHGSGHMEFENKKNAVIGFSFDSVYQNNYSIWAEKGLISVQRAYSIPADMKPMIELYTNIDFKESTQAIDAAAANQFELAFRNFCRTILKKDDRTRTGKYNQILNQARALEALRRSAKSNQTIKLKDIA